MRKIINGRRDFAKHFHPCHNRLSRQNIVNLRLPVKNRVDLLWPIAALLVSGAALVRPLPFFSDDALFYPQIAFNIVSTGASTFNGITLTNGYHPLWMLVNIIVMIAAGANKLRALRILVAIEVVILVAMVFYFLRLMDRLSLQSRALGVSIVLLLVCTGLFGLETHLSALMIVVFQIQLLDSVEKDTKEHWLRLGVVAALLMLARLDNVFLVVASLAVLAIRYDVRSFVGRCVWSGIPLSVLVGPYLVYNQISSGHMVPISGEIKTGFPHLTMQIVHLGTLGEITSIIGLASILCANLEFLSAKEKLLLRTMGIGTLLQSAYIFLFSRDYTTHSFWYYMTGIFDAALLANIAMSALVENPNRAKVLRHATATACALLALAAGTRAWLKAFGFNINLLNPQAVNTYDPRHPSFQYLVADWMNQHLPPGSVVLAVDFPGALAYMTNFKIIALDGLTNDFDYEHEIVRDGLSAYVARHDVEYYFGPIVEPGATLQYGTVSSRGEEHSQTIEVHAPLTERSAGTMDLPRSDVLMDAETQLGGTGHGHLAIWKLNNSSKTLAN
ncbi:MAG: hypothetical protein ACLQDV_00425 [Candidatus Binataceae bacterium]